MGKNLKGKECGKGICQRKDGLYSARFADKTGKRHDRCFRELPEARNWLEEARVLDRRGGQSAEPQEESFALPDMTVDAWFELMFCPAVMNGLIPEHPMDGVRYTKPVRVPSDIKYLTVEEQDGQNSTLVVTDLTFINFRTGEPGKNSSYDTHLYKICDENGIKRFCTHALRHTCATRAIESGMEPKVLQKLLGHASIQATMDKYVHVTDDSLTAGVRQFEASGM